MPDQFTPQFEHEVLEADIKRLSAEIRKHEGKPEAKAMTGHELVKQSLQSLTAAPPPEPAAQSAGPLPAYASDAPAETKLEVEYLLDIAFHKGIAKAAAEAKKSNPFVLDAFHDALAGKLYPELQKRGIVK